MKYKILLWLMSWMYQRSANRSEKMQKFLEQSDKKIRFTTEAGKPERTFVFEPGAVSSRSNDQTEADMTIRFVDAKTGFTVLWAMAKGTDKNAFMRAIQEKQVKIEGDMMLLMWFQKSVKYLMAK